MVLQRASQLATLLTHPRCHVYVCGSNNMAQEVAASFGKVRGGGGDNMAQGVASSFGKVRGKGGAS